LLVPASNKSKRATRTILGGYERQADWLVGPVNVYRAKLGMPRWILSKEKGSSPGRQSLKLKPPVSTQVSTQADRQTAICQTGNGSSVDDFREGHDGGRDAQADRQGKSAGA
jgi:hypothetical protein